MNDRSNEQVMDRSKSESDALSASQASASQASASQASASQASASQASVNRYFALLNQAQFQEVAQLFAIEGVLCAPFEDPIVGRAAIATYLETEAKDMNLQPLRQEFERLPDGQIRAEVMGRVQTSLFGVNVGWMFLLNEQAEINLVRVNLLASLQELFQLRPE